MISIIKVTLTFKNGEGLETFVDGIDQIWIADGFFYINHSDKETIAKSTGAIEEFHLLTMG